MTGVVAEPALFPGFADPAIESQRAFRAVLEAMARPGTMLRLLGAPRAPSPIAPAAGAVLLSLADQDTPVWFDGGADAPAIAAWLGFHCGARLLDDPAEAGFALIADATTMPPLSAFPPGSEEYPDRSATIIVQVPSLTGGRSHAFGGPGIRDRIEFAPDGLPDAFATWLVENNALFPRGVDLIFASGDSIVALPRSSRLKG